MLELLRQEANRALTENGAETNVSTYSDCLDLFATIGALRRESDEEILTRFVRAFTENRNLSMKMLFFARDIRGGLGERRVFRVILRYLAENEPASVKKNIPHIAEYGRFDDLLVLLGTPCEDAAISYLKQQLEKDIAALEHDGDVSLLGKWLPSVNASAPKTVSAAKRICRAMGMSEAEYRKALTKLRARIRILENNLREKDYTFDYAKQPGKAMLKYRKAFLRNDGERYLSFIEQVSRGEAKLHADTLLPYELVTPFLSDHFFTSEGRCFMRSISPEEKAALNATWQSLPAFTAEGNALAVIDTSGSMYWDAEPLPAAVALSLGLYFAEHSAGAFRNCFIEFSEHPQLIELKGETFADRLRYAASFNTAANTNLEAVFELILRTAVKNQVPQEELPETLYIISDMEFDCCVANASLTNFENAKQRFASFGYALPKIVFWNVASRNRQQPVTKNEQGVALVSGCSPRIFKMLSGGLLTPYAFMMDVLGGERYAPISA